VEALYTLNELETGIDLFSKRPENVPEKIQKTCRKLIFKVNRDLARVHSLMKNYEAEKERESKA
jgi:hypothetical protein